MNKNKRKDGNGMPQIKIRGINETDVCKISENMIDK